MSAAERIEAGLLPTVLEYADWRRYVGPYRYERTWSDWARMWRGIAWVRVQAFEREAWAEWEAEEHR